MTRKTLRLTLLGACLALVAALGQPAFAAAPDLEVVSIDLADLAAGGCPGTVGLVVKNRGGEISGAYTVRAELAVGGNNTRTQTYHETLRGFPAGATQTVTFRNVVAQSTYQAAYVIVGKVYVTGGSFREGNTRNNEKKIAEPIRRRCPRDTAPSNPGGTYGNGSPSGTTGGSRPPATAPSSGGGYGGTATGATDLAIQDIDLSALSCGGCPGSVTVDVANGGRELSGAYAVWVELTIGGNGTRTQTYRERLNGFRAGETQKVTFRNVQAQSCYQASYAIGAKTYVTGGSFREGNTRNNEKRIAQPIRQRCR